MTYQEKHDQKVKERRSRAVIERQIEKEFVPKEEEPEKRENNVFTVDPNISNFEHLQISDKLKQILKENGFEKLTNIQRNSIPVILETRNVVLKSETGSGKTLAYLVPMIEFLSKYSLTVEKIHRE